MTSRCKLPERSHTVVSYEQLLQARKSSLGTAFQCLLIHPSMDKFVRDFFSHQLCDHLRSNSQFFQNAIPPELEGTISGKRELFDDFSSVRARLLFQFCAHRFNTGEKKLFST
jgi:hypothetical protein